jgi:hypothetical protein
MHTVATVATATTAATEPPTTPATIYSKKSNVVKFRGFSVKIVLFAEF